MYNFVSLLIPLSNMNIVMKKSIHICFSPKKGRSDMASFPEVMIVLYQNIYKCYMSVINV